jgi:hypothetical protein
MTTTANNLFRRVDHNVPLGTYTPTHGTLFSGKGSTRWCCRCKTHRALGSGWKKLRQRDIGLTCPECVGKDKAAKAAKEAA